MMLIFIIAFLMILGAIAVWLCLPRKLARRLGYPPGTVLLIVHADDFGVCHSTNLATIRALETGVVTSASLMVPCPAFEEASDYCRRNPEADIGIHLTFTNEYEKYNWGPVSPAANVPGLLNRRGHFHSTTQEVWQHASPEEIEIEMRAQIEKALAAGVRPTHLDSHMGVLFGPKFFSVYLRVATEYNLPAMLPRKYVFSEQIEGVTTPYKILYKLLGLWLDLKGHLLMDRVYAGGFDERNIPQDEYYKWVIGDLAQGVNEVLVHLALDSEDVDSLGDSSCRRVEDFRIMTDPATRDLIESRSIILIGYEPISDLFNKR